MATTFSSDKISSGTIKSLPLGYDQSILATAAAPATTGANDIYQMIKLEANPSLDRPNGSGGPTILAVNLGSDDLDAGAAITLDVGDASSAQRFIAAATIGQTGGRVGGTTVSCLGYQPFASPFFNTYTTVSLATYLIQIKVNASAATAVAGNLRVMCDFTIDP